VAARILDGKALAASIKQEVATEVSRLKTQTGVVPGLTVVLVGDDPASQVYVRNKQNSCKAAGMNGHVERYPATTTQAELLATIDRLNDDPAVHGILVQLPLPSQIDERAVVERVDPWKDVDGFHPINVGLLARVSPGSCHALRWASARCCKPPGSRPGEHTPWCSAAHRSWVSRWLSCSCRKVPGVMPRSRSATPRPATPRRWSGRPTS